MTINQISDSDFFKINLDDNIYLVSLEYTITEVNDKVVPNIKKVFLNGTNIKPLLKTEVIESLRSLVFRNINNFTER